ncbi:MAG: hypothetical protein FJ211_02095 [Ignavibacteria bacterium]|nr:hypothetical protein [Ignavibacteria bacterium]
MKHCLTILITLCALQSGLNAQAAATTDSPDKALAVGLGYDYWGYGISARYGDLSALLATEYYTGLSISGDYRLAHDKVSSIENLDWYAGAGAIVSFGSAWYGSSFGARGTAGVLWNPAPKFELFSQISPTLSFGDTYWTGFHFGYSAGVRYRL